MARVLVASSPLKPKSTQKRPSSVIAPTARPPGHGVSRLHPSTRRRVQDDRPARDLREDHCGKRQSARAGVLPEMRIASLFDDARRRTAGILCAARRNTAPARSAHSAGRYGSARRNRGSPKSATCRETKSSKTPRTCANRHRVDPRPGTRHLEHEPEADPGFTTQLSSAENVTWKNSLFSKASRRR